MVIRPEPRQDPRWTSDSLLGPSVDDHTAVLLSDHMRRKGLGDVHDASEVCVHDVIPIGLELLDRLVERVSRGRARRAGVVLKDVDLGCQSRASECLSIPLHPRMWEMPTYLAKDIQDSITEGEDLLDVPDVDEHAVDLADAIDGLEFLLCLFQGRLRDVDEEQGHAFFGVSMSTG